MTKCKACGHAAYDFTYSDEGYQGAPLPSTASGPGHGFAGDLPCKCGCIQTPRITELEEGILWRQGALIVARQRAAQPWKPWSSR